MNDGELKSKVAIIFWLAYIAAINAVVQLIFLAIHIVKNK